MRCLKLVSTEAKHTSIAVAMLAAVGQLRFVASSFGGFHGTIA